MISRLSSIFQMLTLLIAVASMTSAALAQSRGGVLQLVGSGGTFTAPVDAAGNASMHGIPPGSYQLSMLLPAVQKSTTRSASANNLKQMSLAGVSATGTTGAGAGKATFKEFTIMKSTRKASPKLFLYCCRGGHVAELNKTITYTGLEYYVVKLDNVVIPSEDGDRTAESISLNFTKITYNY